MKATGKKDIPGRCGGKPKSFCGGLLWADGRSGGGGNGCFGGGESGKGGSGDKGPAGSDGSGGSVLPLTAAWLGTGGGCVTPEACTGMYEPSLRRPMGGGSGSEDGFDVEGGGPGGG